MPHSLQGIIFDVDGVIADTIELHYRAWKRLTDEEDLPFDRAINERLRGLTRRDSINLLLNGREIGESTRTAWMTRKNAYYLDLLSHMTSADLLPGVRTLLDEAASAGIPVGIGSASLNAHQVLKQVNLLDAFSVIGNPLNVVNNKPAPDLFLWVAGYMNVHPAYTLVIEDGEAGIQAALTGGFKVLGVGEGPIAAAHITIPSLDQINLETITSRLFESVVTGSNR